MAKYTCTFTTEGVTKFHELETDDTNIMLNGILIINRSSGSEDLELDQEQVAISH